MKHSDTSDQSSSISRSRRPFFVALGFNFIWINASEVWRYLFVIKPLLQDTFPNESDIAPFDLGTFAIWSVWDSILIVAATGFFWIYFKSAGATFGQAIVAASFFTVTVFGLLWIGVYNMGLVPAHFIWTALPLAWFEQVVAAAIVWRMFPTEK